ncbi:TTN [Mytilus edulis]|uniref:TTN n=1 Tax=Mytilus edulis TaxID=6550 RepID=A0A8S3TZ61_MYTED|nr:TTN [Mytilus edulis]
MIGVQFEHSVIHIEMISVIRTVTYYLELKLNNENLCIENYTAIITQPLDNVLIMEGLDTVLECETEDENCPVQWLKNGKEISNQSDRIKMIGKVHRLTILQTSLEDSATYTVKTKGRTSQALLTVKEMPATIKQMSVQEKEEFLKAAKSGTAIRYECRVMIVGENEVGKTCLLRRLMNEKIDDVRSTDGINILRRKCQINIQSGEWQFPTEGQVIQPCAPGQSEELADCGFWDFAGQKEFYATHQTFLSTHSVYLLVVDISRDFKTKTYNNMIEKEFNNVGGIHYFIKIN